MAKRRRRRVKINDPNTVFVGKTMFFGQLVFGLMGKIVSDEDVWRSLLSDVENLLYEMTETYGPEHEIVLSIKDPVDDFRERIDSFFSQK